MSTTDERLNTLAEFLGLNEEENAEVVQEDTDGLYSYGNEEYLVLTDEEADDKAKEEIEYSLWAFNSDFIIEHCKNYEDMSTYEWEEAVQSLNKAQRECCENANGLVKALIHDMEEFVEDAIDADGRGHFISRYDGVENELNDYYIYRVN